jgi:hypothetical protein
MATIRVRKLAGLLGVNSAIGLARAAGLQLPSPNHVSLRGLVANLGHPLQPTGMGLFWDLDVARRPIIHPPGAQDVPPNRTINMVWQDAGTGPRRADRWVLQIQEAANGRDISNSPFTLAIAGAFSDTFSASQSYRWTLTPFNDFGAGPAVSATFSVKTPSAPPPPSPPPNLHTLTLQVTLALPVSFSQSITGAGWQISGPGAPTGQVPSPAGGITSQLAVPLPVPSRPANYTVFSTVAFAYDGLVRNNGVSGPENSQVDLSAPTSLPWTGQSRVARFSIGYDSFKNVFTMKFEGLF